MSAESGPGEAGRDALAGNALADALLAELPLDDHGTGHVSDCGYTDEAPDCRCITLRGRLVAAVMDAGWVSPTDHAAALAQAAIAPGDVRDYRRAYSDQVDRAEAAEARVEQQAAQIALVLALADEMHRDAESPDFRRNRAWFRYWETVLRQALTPDAADAHDRRVRAEALREAADVMASRLNDFPAGGRHTRARWAEQWLRDRADREEVGLEPRPRPGGGE